jgi:predicted MFS family arabinose efflux permease
VLGGRSILVPQKTDYPLGGVASGPMRQLRSSAAERRRRNLTYLAIFIIATFLIGLVPQLRFLLIVNLVADLLLIVYLGLAFYLAVWPPTAERNLPLDPDPETRRVGNF